MSAFFLAAALMVFYAQNPFEPIIGQTFYGIFLAASCCGLVLLYLINRTKPFFSFLIGVTTFIFINHLKKTYGAEFIHSPQFIYLSFLLPLNLLFFYFLPLRQLKSRQTVLFLLAFLAEMIIVEHATKQILQVPYIDIAWESIPLLIMPLWLLAIVIMAIDISFKNTLINTGLFYADTTLFLGVLYAGNASGLSIFSLTFVIIILCTTFADLYIRYQHDELENVDSYNAYLVRAVNKFPFKYTVGVFCLDNREKILAEIGPRKMQILEQMLINKMFDEAPDETEFYRYKDDKFLIVFKNEDAKHTYEYCDNIRRAVATAEFIFASKQTVKITISICVSEKTRKYIDAYIVAERGYDGLQKGGRFNNNIVTTAG